MSKCLLDGCISIFDVMKISVTVDILAVTFQ